MQPTQGEPYHKKVKVINLKTVDQSASYICSEAKEGKVKISYYRWEEQTVNLDVRRALIERLQPSTAYYFHVKLTRDEKHQVYCL